VQLAFWYNQAFILEALDLLLILYKIMSVLRLTRVGEIILLTIESASFFVGIYIGFLGLATSLLTILAMNIWAPFNIKYKEFSEAFISILLLSMGQIDRK